MSKIFLYYAINNSLMTPEEQYQHLRFIIKNFYLELSEIMLIFVLTKEPKP